MPIEAILKFLKSIIPNGAHYLSPSKHYFSHPSLVFFNILQTLGPSLSIFGLQIGPQVINKCWNIGPQGLQIGLPTFDGIPFSASGSIQSH
jgi:hypothetical protein